MEKKLIILILIIIQPIFAKENQQAVSFLPNIFKQFPNVRDFTISSTEDEAYFTAQSPLGELSVIARIIKENETWSNPEIVHFSGKYSDLEPFLSHDGMRLYFASTRPVDETSDKEKDYDLWYVQRDNKNSEWSSPINVGAPVNTEHNEFYPSLSVNENIYFTSDAPASKGKDDIFFSKWENGQYLDPVSLSDSVNSKGYEFNAYVAPDESYIIFSGYNREGGLGSGDLYISYQNGDGIWSKAKNLGKDVNSNKMDYCPFVNNDTKTLFFTSKRSLLQKGQSTFSNMQAFLTEINRYENGLSRIYKIHFDNNEKAGK